MSRQLLVDGLEQLREILASRLEREALEAIAARGRFGVARRLWLEPARVPAERIHRMEAEAADPERAALAYSDTLAQVAGATPRFLDVEAEGKARVH